MVEVFYNYFLLDTFGIVFCWDFDLRVLFIYLFIIIIIRVFLQLSFIRFSIFVGDFGFVLFSFVFFFLSWV